MDILEAVTILRPNTHWNLRGDTLEQCEGEPKVSVPSMKEIQVILDENKYISLRMRAYPPITDLADALVHQANGDLQPLAEYVQKCNMVKKQFPK